MTKGSLTRFLAVVAAAAIAAHVLTAGVVTLAMRTLYEHRIYNARGLSSDGAERFRLVGSFLVENARVGLLPVIAFAGSSVTYGYPWHERFVFSRLVGDRKRATKVINASIVAADINGVNDWIVCSARGNRVRFDVLVIEIPLVNTTSHLVDYHKRGLRAPALARCDVDRDDPGYFELTTLHLRGIGWLRFLWNGEARETVESAIRIGPVPKGYFASAMDFAAVQQDYADRIRETLTNAQQVADAVYAFPSPIYVGGLEEVGEDAEAMREQLQHTVDTCTSVSGVRCVDTASIWMNRTYFYNLTHLSQAGHHAAAELLAAAIEVPMRDARR